jgi:hypothetical protein
MVVALGELPLHLAIAGLPVNTTITSMEAVGGYTLSSQVLKIALDWPTFVSVYSALLQFYLTVSAKPAIARLCKVSICSIFRFGSHTPSEIEYCVARDGL